MAITFNQNQIIFQAGQPLLTLHLVIKGKVQAAFPGGSLTLEKGDVIGICEAGFANCQMTYTALTEVSAVSYPFSGMDSLESLFQTVPDLASLFAVSLCRQVYTLSALCSRKEYNCGSLYQSCMGDYARYKEVCERNLMKVRPLPGLSSLRPYFNEEPPEDWLNAYYEGLYHIFVKGEGSAFSKEPAVIIGLIGKAVADAGHMIDILKTMQDYSSSICQLYMNEDLLDYFDMYTAMYLKIGQDSPDAAAVLDDIRRISRFMEKENGIDTAFMTQRVSDFANRLATLHTSLKTVSEDNQDNTAKLAGSLDLILEYSGMESSAAADFRKNIAKYKALSDKNATDDSVRKLRMDLTKAYYSLYALLFFKSLTDKSVPLPVKMLLYFGYVDEELAGAENASYLYSLAASMTSRANTGIYTLYDWLIAIHEGRKDPSRNEFDQDYLENLRHRKVTGKLTDAQEREMADDPVKRVEYELQNMFPLVNKMTFGRISTFCPIFSEHNVLKALSSSYVSVASIGDALNKIRALDYSAFYRESIYTNEPLSITKEYLHNECLPDFILMPNIGSRGVMWQEIEGKKRSTASRMMMSIFELEDIYSTIVRITGEFRWEMCRREQGARWNDLSSRCLTSEYFDYIQFYRKNHDLSVDAREKVKNSLQKAKNSYKEMFVRDYIIWILFEGTGSPRLNKVARSILFSYCPFSAPIRAVLAGNPIYRELTDHYQLELAQRLHHLDNVLRKITSSGNPIPPELEAEKAYMES